MFWTVASGCRGAIQSADRAGSVVHTPWRRETGRLRTAQFADRAVYIPKRREPGMVTADLLSRAGRGRRGAPGRVSPAGVAGAQLPNARIVRRRRGRPTGNDAGRLAGHWR